MYANCGGANEARRFFDEMQNYDIYSWNFILKCYVKAGDHYHALQMFEQMRQECKLPNKFLYVSILALFTNVDDVSKGRLVHACVACGDHASDMILQTALVSMYAKCGSLEAANWVFNRMGDKDSAAWNALIAGHAKYGLRKESLHLLGKMRSHGMLPNSGTIVTVLSTCSNASSITDGRWIHSQMKGTDLDCDVTVNNALITMYGKCGSLNEAKSVFHEMKCRNNITFLNMLTACASEASLDEAKKLQKVIYDSELELDTVINNALINMLGKCGGIKEAQDVFEKMENRNLISWNSLLAVHSHNMECDCALQIFNQMLQEGVMPNRITLVSAIDACAGLKDERQGKNLHVMISNGEAERGVILDTALMHMYGRFKHFEDVKDIFEKVEDRDLPCWNAIITLNTQHDRGDIAFCQFYQMQEEGILPDRITFISLLSGCASESALEHGKCLHARFASSRLVSDDVIGNALINMYGKCSSLKDAMEIFYMMKNRDYVTYVNIFSVCANNAALHEGRRIHNSIIGSDIEQNAVVGNVIINMYGKCGSLKHAIKFFDCMLDRNTVSWNAMLSVYAQNGLGYMALELFRQMNCKREEVNGVTLVCILSACSHAGLIDEGYTYFYLIFQRYFITPNADHYNCMIDMLARAGRLDEAEELIKIMVMVHEPSVVTWTALFSACSSQLDTERAVRVTLQVLQLNPNKTSAYIMLSNIFTAAGREDVAASIMCMMRGLKEHSSSLEEMMNEISSLNSNSDATDFEGCFGLQMEMRAAV
ncbi:hypothetical protein KP509_15G026300 [Ceratopteris richardii]|nr:hypothetical protein KP509_15G026300 [Ceratopteris richardii]